MNHELKILPVHFQDVIDGFKKAEFRKADRDYRVGDFIHLREWNGEYCGREARVRVIHVCDLDQWAPGFVMLSVDAVTLIQRSQAI